MAMYQNFTSMYVEYLLNQYLFELTKRKLTQYFQGIVSYLELER